MSRSTFECGKGGKLMEDLDQIFDDIALRVKIYGYFFTVTNKIQAMGDKVLDGLTMRQQYLMVILSKFETYAPTLQELAYVFGSSYQNVKRMASQLEEKGYLDIRKDPIDRRKIRIILNRKKYNSLRDDLGQSTDEFFNKVYKGLSEKELNKLGEALTLIDKNISKLDEDLA